MINQIDKESFYFSLAFLHFINAVNLIISNF